MRRRPWRPARPRRTRRARRPGACEGLDAKSCACGATAKGEDAGEWRAQSREACSGECGERDSTGGRRRVAGNESAHIICVGHHPSGALTHRARASSLAEEARRRAQSASPQPARRARATQRAPRRSGKPGVTARAPALSRRRRFPESPRRPAAPVEKTLEEKSRFEQGAAVKLTLLAVSVSLSGRISLGAYQARPQTDMSLIRGSYGADTSVSLAP